ncbi:MAG: helix-turn-helix domain-containing protein [Victivallales bacterium]|nr:helix-turn-helix domain-containing protein [Victivallales bacterium]
MSSSPPVNRFYHSTLLALVRAEDLPVFIRRVSAGHHPNRLFHDHDYTEIAMVASGEPLHVLGDGTTIRLHPGDVLILRPGLIHAYDEAEELSIVNVVFRPEVMFSSAILEDWNALPLNAATGQFALLHLESQQRVSFLSAVDALERELKGLRTGFRVAVTTRLLEVALALLRRPGQDADQDAVRLEHCIDYISRHYGATLNIDALCRIAAMSRRNLFRQFRLLTGSSPLEYLISVRLHQAVNRLLSTTDTVAAIAQDCGFYDSNAFCRHFQSRFNMTPRQFRQASIVKGNTKEDGKNTLAQNEDSLAQKKR